MIIIGVMLLLITASMFLLLTNPMTIGVMLFFLSLLVVIKMGFLISSWYAYMLFLVYVGGLLVMFIYICMISSNFQLGNYINIWEIGLLLMVVSLASQYITNQKSILYYSSSLNGITLPFLLFLALGVYLLISFLAILNVILSGGVTLKLAQ